MAMFKRTRRKRLPMKQRSYVSTSVSVKKKRSKAHRSYRRNMSELSALDRAYGRRLTARRKILLSIQPMLMMIAISLLFWLNPLYTIISGVLGFAYGYLWVMPREVKAQYDEDSLQQRNIAINLGAQAIGDSNKTIVNVLDTISSHIEGELRADFRGLHQIVVRHENNISIKRAFDEFRLKYDDDVVFGRFLEQLETVVYEGDPDPKIFSDLRKQHNESLEQIKIMTRSVKHKKAETNLMFILVCGMGVALILIGVSFVGFNTYAKYFFYGKMGLFSGLLFMMGNIIVIHKFNKRFYDRSVTTF